MFTKDLTIFNAVGPQFQHYGPKALLTCLSTHVTLTLKVPSRHYPYVEHLRH